jgi:hypothetical protein
MTGKKIVWAMIAVAAAVVIALFLRAHWFRSIPALRSITIEGAVTQRDADTKKELPIAGVAITASDGMKSATTQSDASGYFKLVVQRGVLSDKPVMVSFRHPSYEPLDLNVQTERLETQDKLYIAAMVPVAAKTAAGPRHPEKIVSNIRVRYTTNSRTETNVGSAVKITSLLVPLMGSGRLLVRLLRWMQERTIRSTMSEPPVLRGHARLRGLTQVDLFTAAATSVFQLSTGRTRPPS